MKTNIASGSIASKMRWNGNLIQRISTKFFIVFLHRKLINFIKRHTCHRFRIDSLVTFDNPFSFESVNLILGLGMLGSVDDNQLCSRHCFAVIRFLKKEKREKNLLNLCPIKSNTFH